MTDVRYTIEIVDFDALRHRKTGEDAKRPLTWTRTSNSDVLSDHRIGTLTDAQFRLLFVLRALCAQAFDLEANASGAVVVSLLDLGWHLRREVGESDLRALENQGLIRLGTNSVPARYQDGTEVVPTYVRTYERKVRGTGTGTESTPKGTRRRREYPKAFEAFWLAFPDRPGVPKGDKPKALTAFAKAVDGEDDEAAILVATRNYGRSPDVAKGFRKDAERWLPNWREWLAVAGSPASAAERTPTDPRILELAQRRREEAAR